MGYQTARQLAARLVPTGGKSGAFSDINRDIRALDMALQTVVETRLLRDRTAILTIDSNIIRGAFLQANVNDLLHSVVQQRQIAE